MSDRMERIEAGMDKLTDKMDEVLSVLGDIRANEKINEHRFNEVDRRHDELVERVSTRLKKLENEAVTKTEFSPYKKGMALVAGTIATGICIGLLTLLLNQPVLTNKQAMPKPLVSQNTEGGKDG